MSSKDVGRPLGDAPRWASDDEWADPGEAWDGEPPQAEPAGGYISQGFLPEKPMPADYANFLFADHGARLRALDGLDVQNYPIGGVVTANGNAAGDACCLTWHLTRRILYVGGGSFDDEGFVSYDDGVHWAADYTSGNASDDITCCATREWNEVSGQSTNLATALGVSLNAGTAAVVTRGTSGGAWVQTALTSSLTVARVKADGFQTSGFWIAGRGTGNLPAIWSFTDNGGGAAFAQARYTDPGGANNGYDTIAVGRGVVLAALWTGTNAIIGRKDAAVCAIAAVTHPGASTQRVMYLLFEPLSNTFIMLTQAPGTGTNVFTSTIGSSGTWASVASTWMGFVNVAAGGAGCVRGSSIVVPVSDGTRNYLAVSTDRGQTWEAIPDPLKRHGAGTAVATIARRLDRRFGVFGYQGTGTHTFALGTRTGRA